MRGWGWGLEGRGGTRPGFGGSRWNSAGVWRAEFHLGQAALPETQVAGVVPGPPKTGPPWVRPAEVSAADAAAYGSVRADGGPSSTSARRRCLKHKWPGWNPALQGTPPPPAPPRQNITSPAHLPLRHPIPERAAQAILLHIRSYYSPPIPYCRAVHDNQLRCPALQSDEVSLKKFKHRRGIDLVTVSGLKLHPVQQSEE